MAIPKRFQPTPNESLRQKQARFSLMVASLILWAHQQGYEVTLGDAFRDKRVFGTLGEKKGYGRSSSLHKQRLALDLNLFIDGKFIQSSKGHTPLGEKWESWGGSWGGRFNDGNHYSLEHGGRR